MNYQTFKNLALKESAKELIMDEIDELVEDFKAFHEDFAKQWLHDNSDWLDENGINEEALSEMTGECIEYYCSNEYYNDLYLSDKVMQYMRNKLPDDEKKMIEWKCRISGNSVKQEIIGCYLKHVADLDE